MKKYFLIISLLIIVAFAFYWYEWRPRSIKSSCHTMAVNNAKKYLKENFSRLDGVTSEDMYQEKYRVIDYDKYYRDCTRESRL